MILYLFIYHLHDIQVNTSFQVVRWVLSSHSPMLLPLHTLHTGLDHFIVMFHDLFQYLPLPQPPCKIHLKGLLFAETEINLVYPDCDPNLHVNQCQHSHKNVLYRPQNAALSHTLLLHLFI